MDDLDIKTLNSSNSSILSRSSSSSNRSLSRSFSKEVYVKLGNKVSTKNGKIGQVRYVGATDFADGIWVGIELDNPG